MGGGAALKVCGGLAEDVAGPCGIWFEPGPNPVCIYVGLVPERIGNALATVIGPDVVPPIIGVVLGIPVGAEVDIGGCAGCVG